MGKPGGSVVGAPVCGVVDPGVGFRVGIRVAGSVLVGMAVGVVVGMDVVGCCGAVVAIVGRSVVGWLVGRLVKMLAPETQN